VNSSYFWICTSLTKLSVSDAVFSYGGATFIGGMVSFAAVCVMWVSGLI
jgi:GntP family gluconate:H+ symporter